MLLHQFPFGDGGFPLVNLLGKLRPFPGMVFCLSGISRFLKILPCFLEIVPGGVTACDIDIGFRRRRDRLVEKVSAENDGKRQDVNLWFRQEHGTVPGLTAPEGETYTAYCGEDPAGLLVLRDREAAGEIVYMGLREAYRGQGLAVQLFGQAVFTLRAAGKARLILTRPADCPAFDALLRQMDLRPDSQGRCAMELKLQVFPLLEEALV